MLPAVAREGMLRLCFGQLVLRGSPCKMAGSQACEEIHSNLAVAG